MIYPSIVCEFKDLQCRGLHTSHQSNSWGLNVKRAVLISGCVRNDVVLCNKSGSTIISQMILHSNSVKMGIRLCYKGA
jgi:hypothetical protein